MAHKIILLSGTPASGKDTVTDALCHKHSQFTHFKKHKMGKSGRIDNTYIFVDDAQFNNMVSNDEFLQYHYRYGRGYAVSYAELKKNWELGFTPIIHVGKYENISAFYQNCNFNTTIEIISILLLVDHQTTKFRLESRHPNDSQQVTERMNAYYEERRELATLIQSGEPLLFDVIIDNSKSLDTTVHLLENILLQN